MTDPPIEAEDRRKHLDFIQAIITRMSAASATTKSWLLPVVTAAYGYALTQSADSVALLGLMAVVLFGLMDANYLRQERAYRRLYNAVARGSRPVTLYSLDPSDADDPISPSGSAVQTVAMAARRWFPDMKVLTSWSIAPFYGALVIVGCVIAIRAA
jgi:hypothetical protein